jgi:hypothetical protein
MPAVGIVLDEKHKQIALKNNISLQTVYARIKRGWNVDRAVSEVPQKTNVHVLPRSNRGPVLAGEHPKGKHRSIRLYKYMDNEIDQIIEEMGLNQSDFIAMAVEQYYKNIYLKGKRD